MAANAPRQMLDSEVQSADPVSIELAPPDAKVIVRPLQIYSLLVYYIGVLAAAMALFIFLIVSSNWQPSKIPLLRTVCFVAAGALIGSVLYQIRMLYQYYVQDGAFDAKWIGKYISAPWEAVALALVVLSLLQGGGAALGGAQININVSDANSFAAFGIGALVGFGIREVVGWLGNLAKTMFPTDHLKESKEKPQEKPKDKTQV
jgi:hypothetical protein